MLMKLVPGRLKDYVKQKIANASYATRNAYVGFRPYRQGHDSFCVAKQKEENPITCEHGLPVPPPELFLGYGPTVEQYLDSGRNNIAVMMEMLDGSGFSLENGSRVLDFGCGAGRMLRHLHPYANECELWGMDISSEHVFWCKQNLSPPFHFATGTTIPHLPFEDRYFDLIICGSVFSHIDDLAESWMLELHRVLSSSGRLYVTIHDQHTMALLDGPRSDAFLADIVNANEMYVSRRYDSGMLVIGRGDESQVFYDRDYFCDLVKPKLKVVAVQPEAYGYQTGLLLARGPAGNPITAANRE